MNDLAGNAPEPLLDVSDLTIACGGGVLAAPARTIVRDVSLRIARGEIFALVGESGSGKSTILRAIAGITPVGRGRIRFMGEDITHLGRRRRRPFAARLQMVFQDPYASLDPKMTVGLSAVEPLGAAAPELTRDERRERAAAAFAEVGLDRSALDRYPHEFSGGQRQRIAIARALITSPELLLLDEPVSALDVSVRAQVLNLLLDLRRSRGLSYLFVSHDLAVVRLIADRVAVLSAGKIVETGAATDVIDRPSHPYTRALRAAVPSPIVRGAHR